MKVNKIKDISSKKTSLLGIKDMILNTVELINEDEIVLYVYFPLPSKFKWISDGIEKMLLLSKLNTDKFHIEFDTFIINSCMNIKNNCLYKDYYEFIYVVLSNIKKINNDIIPNLYLSIVSEIFNQLSPDKKDIWGFDMIGNPIYKDEPYKVLTEAMNEMYIKKKNNIDTRKLKNIYNVEGTIEDIFDELIEKERIFSNTLTLVAGLMDENDIEYYSSEKDLDITAINHKIREWRSTEYYKEVLKEKRYVLPKDGVKCVFKNLPDIQEINFKEKMFLDYKVIIFKITHSKGGTSMGFYIPFLDLYFDICLAKNIAASKTYENFILEVYSRLTTDIDMTYRRMHSICITDLKNPDGYYLQQPLMQVFSKNVENIIINKKERIKISYRNFSKEEYIPVNILIAPFIRKLPEGQFASDRALEAAAKYGYKLKPGETFVTQFPKRIFHKDNREL